jgi:hypothetical protein
MHAAFATANKRQNGSIGRKREMESISFIVDRSSMTWRNST